MILYAHYSERTETTQNYSKQNKGYCATNGIDAVTLIIIYKSVRAELTDTGRFMLINKDGKEIWAANN